MLVKAFNILFLVWISERSEVQKVSILSLLRVVYQ